MQPPFAPELFRGALILEAPPGAPSPCVVFDEETAWCYAALPDGTTNGPSGVRFRVGWRPGLPDGAALRFPPLSWLRPSQSLLELVEVDEGGTVRCAGLEWGPSPGRLGSLAFAAKERFRAAAFVGRDRLAAVRPGGVDWLRRGEDRLVLAATTTTALGDAVACFYSVPTRELLVATDQGDVVRVPAADF